MRKGSIADSTEPYDERRDLRIVCAHSAPQITRNKTNWLKRLKQNSN